jgi:hypothetical protein
MTFGTPQELGFCPNITPVKYHKKTHYLYNINGQHFLTVKPLREIAPLSFCGRSLRAFSVIKAAPDGTPECEVNEVGEPINKADSHVLKHYFDQSEQSGEVREAIMLRRIMEALEKLKQALIECRNMPIWDSTVDSLSEDPAIARPQDIPKLVWDFLCVLSPAERLGEDGVIEAVLNYRNYFINILHSQAEPEQFPIGNLGPRDTSMPYEVHRAQWVQGPSIHTDSLRVDNSKAYPAPEKPTHHMRTMTDRTFHKMARCQVVYEQCCVALQDVDKFDCVQTVLHDAAMGICLFIIALTFADLTISQPFDVLRWLRPSGSKSWKYLLRSRNKARTNQ